MQWLFAAYSIYPSSKGSAGKINTLAIRPAIFIEKGLQVFIVRFFLGVERRSWGAYIEFSYKNVWIQYFNEIAFSS